MEGLMAENTFYTRKYAQCSIFLVSSSDEDDSLETVTAVFPLL